MPSLLARMHIEHFVLDLLQPLLEAPSIPGYQLELITPKVLSVAVPKERGINQLFIQLNALNIQVSSLKNKTNRFEQLFSDLIDTQVGDVAL